MSFVPDNNIKVSVSIITYNHEKFIAKTIESVLSQEVNFKYEIIIGDDHSSDKTREILKKYKEKYPELIHLILHPRRYKEIPGRTNNTTNIYACQGKYIALLDGDDYWVSKNKLQTQVDFLDAYKDYALSFHDAKLISEENSFIANFFSEKYAYLYQDASFNHKDVVNEWFVPTSSLVFRNNLIKEFPAWFWKVYSADYALLLLLSQHGKLRFFKNLTSVWRRNNSSFTSVIKLDSTAGIDLRLVERKIFRENFELVKASKTEAHFNYMHSILLARRKSYIKMAYYAGKCVFNDLSYLGKYLTGFKKRFK